jgi:Ca2+-binding RTX toxin-like protein
MVGGNGDDTYVVDDAGDIVDETSGRGTDRVASSTSFTLAGGVENLILTDAAAINGTGNGSNNLIIGNSAANLLSGLGSDDTLFGLDGNDRLDGGVGADTMTGGDGDDTYVIDNAEDSADENSASGNDTVQSTVSFTLGGNFETLVLDGSAAIDGTGNADANTLYGNSASNRLDGDAGDDTLTGFGAADVFVFGDASGADTVTDFGNGADQFDLTAVSGVNDFSDLTVVDNGATVTVDYGTGSFTIGNVGNPTQIDAGDFVFA